MAGGPAGLSHRRLPREACEWLGGSSRPRLANRGERAGGKSLLMPCAGR